ncbi:hypothetical protein PR048_010906 [Dryococelus australis]|uniref:Uncharacterized protein n=1 Tax=Dryococelus australis TaxID=614101 RepID=A0ABQ9I404_9NEOP|nr:hypothetical protein PR048_010906 [Dryococelus australis]
MRKDVYNGDQVHVAIEEYTLSISLLASYQDELGLIPGRVTPGFSQVGIVPDDAAGWQILCKFLEDNDECKYAIDELLSILNKAKSTEDEVQHMVETADKFIRQEICSQVYDCDVYPSVEEIKFGNSDVKGYRKSLSTQHALTAAVRPLSFVSPLHVGLGAHLHRKYGSRLLTGMLFEASVTAKAPATIYDSAHIQFVFDNADYNVATLDGHRTFHAMGGIVRATPADSVRLDTPVPRTGCIGATALGSYGLRKVAVYRRPMTQEYSLTIAENLRTKSLEPTSARTALGLDALWMCGSWLKLLPCPSWSGFISNVHSREYRLQHICYPEQWDKYRKSCCMVTFDQPLYVKAYEMILAADKDSALSHVVVWLGGFHLLLSFMGAVGHLMAGSGLEIYGRHVVHMTSGRAYSRGLRAHLLTQHALATLLLESLSLDDALKNELKACYVSLSENTASQEDIEQASIQQEIAYINMKMFLDWLHLQNPFSRCLHVLASLPSGVVVIEDVNCDNAISIGTASMKAIEEKVFSDIHLQRKNSVRPLESVTKTMRVRDGEVCINPNQFLHPIFCILKSEEELAFY